MAGLVQGASHGEGLGNEFLAQIREVDALLHLVRCFPDPNVMHVIGEFDPLRDIAVIESELILADLGTLERRKQRLEKQMKTGTKSAQEELAFIGKLEDLLGENVWLYGQKFSPEENQKLQDYQLLSVKPVFYVANVLEGVGADDPLVKLVMAHGDQRGAKTIILSGQIEAELAALSENERMEFFREMGLQESGLQRLLAQAHEVLGLITFFTAGEEESRAWTIRNGTQAQVAAGKIHSDIQRGFIRAEVFTYDDLIRCGNPASVREEGFFRLEGREYIVQDGDVVYFRFNV